MIWHQEQEAEWTEVRYKKSYADAVRIHSNSSSPAPRVSSSKPSIFKRLSYPKNYQLNFTRPAEPVASNSCIHPRIHRARSHPQQRVLRWVPKAQRSARGNGGANSPGDQFDFKIQIPPANQTSGPILKPQSSGVKKVWKARTVKENCHSGSSFGKESAACYRMGHTRKVYRPHSKERSQSGRCSAFI